MNRAMFTGGAIYFGSRAAARFSSVAFSEQYSGFTPGETSNTGIRGGAIYFGADAMATFSFATFSGNGAYYGGAIFFGADAVVTFSFATFSGNDAYSGGAIYFESRAAATFSSVAFIEQHSSVGRAVGEQQSDGGAVYFGADAVATFSFAAFSGNTASYGGAIYFESRAAATFSSVAFTGNTAGITGGAIYALGGLSLAMSACTLLANAAYSADHVNAAGVERLYIRDTTFDPFASGGGASVNVGGALGGCAEHPCTLGHGCAYQNYSLACSPCPGSLVGSDGVQCTVCAAGQGPTSADQTSNGAHRPGRSLFVQAHGWQFREPTIPAASATSLSVNPAPFFRKSLSYII
jgi:predicted outer membrane repeat protein